MKKVAQLTLRLEESVIARLEHLAAQHGEMKISTFARMALTRGLPEIEKEYLGKSKPISNPVAQKAA